MRLGFRQIKGLAEAEMEFLVNGRGSGYKTIPELMEAAVSQNTLERLADADAFRPLGPDRRQALWEVSARADRPVAMFEKHDSKTKTEPQMSLPLCLYRSSKSLHLEELEIL